MMTNRLAQFKQWLIEKRAFRVKLFTRDPHQAREPNEALAQLPDDLSDALIEAVNSLLGPPCEQTAVLKTVNEAIAQWRNRPQTSNNSIVVLSTPVTSVSRILADALSNDQKRDENKNQTEDQKKGKNKASENDKSQNDDLLPVNLLNWVERPPETASIQQQLREKLAAPDEAADNKTDQTDHIKPKNLAVIPSLSWCFLRSADGLDGIDYLRDTLLSDRTQFWIIGSGIVGWEYLKSTLKFHTYCGETFLLPKLTGEDLQSWLQPIIEKFDIYFNDAALHKRLKQPNSLLEIDVSADEPIQSLAEITSEISQEVSATMQSSLRAVKDEFLPSDHQDDPKSPESDYFERLADISDGVGIVAIQLFLKSLRYQEKKEDEEGEEGEKEEPANSESTKSKQDQATQNQAAQDQDEENSDRRKTITRIITTTPKLPPLPDLSQSDLYLLYSLMLHGDLTIKAMAESLGDAPQVVNNQVQMLRSKGIIEQKGKVIKANPIHYPRLRRELTNNNFMIEMP